LVHSLIDTRRNPFYKHADLKLWIARRDGRAVGRIGAIVNHLHSEIHQDGAGFFGFFECEDDPSTATMLLDEAAAWLRAQGCQTLRGPVDPSMNHECGVLIEPFDEPARVMTRWNPPYYPELLGAAGLAPVRTMYGYWLDAERGLSDLAIHARIVERVRRQGHLRCREFDFSNFERDAEIVRHLYNEAWREQWGFVPMTRAEFFDMAGALRLVAVPEGVLIIEDDKQPVAFLFAIPDLHEVQRTNPGGRLTPRTIWNLLRLKKTFSQGRIILLGVLPEYRNRGVFSLLVEELIERGRRPGRTGVEGSWILEENEALRGILEAVAPPVRRWQMFERTISG